MLTISRRLGEKYNNNEQKLEGVQWYYELSNQVEKKKLVSSKLNKSQSNRSNRYDERKEW